MIFGRRTVTVGEASGRRLGKEAEGESFSGVFGFFGGGEIWWGSSLLD